MNSITAYPLCWPPGRPRTPYSKRAVNYSFDRKRTRTTAQQELLSELRKLGATGAIISSNLKLRNDGLPYSQQPRNDDEGVAVYFDLKGKAMCFSCDSYCDAAQNLWAIKLTIEALRGIERWGAGDMLERAFTGFAALPASTPVYPDFFDGCQTKDQVDARYRELVKKHHPDAGGSDELMAEINRQKLSTVKPDGN